MKHEEEMKSPGPQALLNMLHAGLMNGKMRGALAAFPSSLKTLADDLGFTNDVLGLADYIAMVVPQANRQAYMTSGTIATAYYATVKGAQDRVTRGFTRVLGAAAYISVQRKLGAKDGQTIGRPVTAEGLDVLGHVLLTQGKRAADDRALQLMN